jgi:hypothetical protein
VVSTSLVIAAAVVLVVVVLAVAVLLAMRARRSAPGRSALPEAPAPGAYTCPFCKRPYDPAQSGNRCPACGAAAPR